MTINPSTRESSSRVIGEKLEFDESASQQNSFFLLKRVWAELACWKRGHAGQMWRKRINSSFCLNPCPHVFDKHIYISFLLCFIKRLFWSLIPCVAYHVVSCPDSKKLFPPSRQAKWRLYNLELIDVQEIGHIQIANSHSYELVNLCSIETTAPTSSRRNNF